MWARRENLIQCEGIPGVRPLDPRGWLPVHSFRCGRLIVYGTSLPLSSVFTDDRLRTMLAHAVTIQGLGTNAGRWYLGTSQVTRANYGWSGVALDTLKLPRVERPCYDLSQLYLLTDNPGEGVTFFFE